MSIVAFTVETEPQPKQRPRVVNGRAYTPQKTRAFETHVAWLARMAMGERPPMTGDVTVQLAFTRSNRRRADLDNMIKAVMDALNGVVYKDDVQVVELHATITRGAADAGVRVEVVEAE